MSENKTLEEHVQAIEQEVEQLRSQPVSKDAVLQIEEEERRRRSRANSLIYLSRQNKKGAHSSFAQNTMPHLD